MVVQFRIPTPSSQMVTNLVGFFGLLAVVFAIGGLTGNWWYALLAAGVFAVGLACLAQNGVRAVADEVSEARKRKAA